MEGGAAPPGDFSKHCTISREEHKHLPVSLLDFVTISFIAIDQCKQYFKTSSENTVSVSELFRRIPVNLVIPNVFV